MLLSQAFSVKESIVSTVSRNRGTRFDCVLAIAESTRRHGEDEM